MTESTTLGIKIKEIRVKKGLTQKGMALALKVTQSYVSKIESGSADPNLFFLKNFRKRYKINLNALLC